MKPKLLLKTFRQRENTNAVPPVEHVGAETPVNNQVDSGQSRLCSLSVHPEESGIVYPPFSIVREMFQDASSLISGGNNIINASGCSTRDVFFVSNDKDRLNPFAVTVQNVTIKFQQENCVKCIPCHKGQKSKTDIYIDYISS